MFLFPQEFLKQLCEDSSHHTQDRISSLPFLLYLQHQCFTGQPSASITVFLCLDLSLGCQTLILEKSRAAETFLTGEVSLKNLQQ